MTWMESPAERLFPDDFALAGQVFFQVKLLTVENAVGKVADPVSQADYMAVFGDTDVKGDVTVTEYKIFNVRVLYQLLLGKLDLMFIFLAQEGTKCTVFHTALF
jgi:hypothetical protein